MSLLGVLGVSGTWVGSNPVSSLEVGNPPVQGGPGHPEVTGDVRCGLALFNEPAGVGDLAVTEDWASPAEVHACVAALHLPSLKPMGQGEHVRRRPAKAVKGRDEQSITLLKRGQGFVELRTSPDSKCVHSPLSPTSAQGSNELPSTTKKCWRPGRPQRAPLGRCSRASLPESSRRHRCSNEQSTRPRSLEAKRSQVAR